MLPVFGARRRLEKMCIRDRVCFVLPAVICWAIGLLCRRLGWIREGDLKLD